MDPPDKFLIGVAEKPVPEAELPKPSAGLAGLDAAGTGGVKPGNADFGGLGLCSFCFSELDSAGEIGSYVGGFVGVTNVLVETWVKAEFIFKSDFVHT